jgi:hypothetical protein
MISLTRLSDFATTFDNSLQKYLHQMRNDTVQ